MLRPYSEEVYKLCEQGRAKQELDALYGRGSRRCIRRSAHWADNHGKFRHINHARTSGLIVGRGPRLRPSGARTFEMAGPILREASAPLRRD